MTDEHDEVVAERGKRIARFIDWLWDDCKQEERPGDKLLYERIAWLVKANGGFEIMGWGFMSYQGVWQQGLDQNDALHLMQFKAYFDGISAHAGFNAYDLFEPYFEQYVERIERESEWCEENIKT